MIREREGLHVKQNYPACICRNKVYRGLWGRGVSLWDSTVIISRILLDLLLVSTQFAVGSIIVACKQVLHINGLTSDCACLTQKDSVRVN